MRDIKHAALFWAVGTLMTLLLAVAAPSQAMAQAAPGTPIVRGTVIRDYARLTFHWPTRVNSFSANVNGNRLTIQFDRPVNPNFGEILRTLYPYVVKAELAANQRTVIFTLNSIAYTTRTFISDSETGVDILGIDKPPVAPVQTITAESQPPTAPAAAPPQPASQSAPTQTANTVIWRNPPVPAPKPVRTFETTESGTPPEQIPTTPAPVPEQTAVAAPEPVAEPIPEPAPAPPPIPEKAVPVVEVAETPLPAPPPSAAPVPAGIRLSGLSTREILTRNAPRNAPASGTPLPVAFSFVNKLPSLHFPFEEPAAVAAWMRGRTAWVLFNQPRRLTGLPEVLQASRGWLTGMQQYGGDGYTLLRLDLLTDVYIRTEKDRQGNGWSVRISSLPVLPDNPLLAEVSEQDGRLSAYIGVTGSAGPFTIYDPVMHDSPRVVPLYASSTGVRPPRQFIDFTVPMTIQGIIVVPAADDVTVSRTERAVLVSTESGMTISAEAQHADAESLTAGDNKLHLFMPTLFPYRNWAVEDETDFKNKEHYYLYQATAADNLNEKNQWRQKLAELYFGQGMINEALGVLGSIRRDDLDYFRAQKLAAMEGAAHLLKYRLPEAELSLSSDVLKDNEEADLLRKTVLAIQDPAADPVPYVEMDNTYIRQYPPALRQRLAIIAANQAIMQRDYKTPGMIFNSLKADKVSKEIEDYISFLQGKVSAALGRVNEAEKTWKGLADKIEDRQFRARAEFALILLGLQEEKITPEEAVERLDRLRIIWRGDDLERSLLMLLGQLNTNLGNYWEGMKAWEELMQYYANTPEASTAYQRLVDTFRMVFLDGGVNDMDPVKALALYTEFQELTPLGADGIRVIENLVDKLVSVDLLDQAANRLRTLIQYRLEGEDKSRGGARLAVIHLLNREPEKAVAALQMSRIEEVPAALSLERNRIAAQALIDLKRYDHALTMIEGDYSTEGEAVRLEAYTRKEDWAYVADILENMLRSREDLNAPFTTEQGQQLVQLTLAYIFLNEPEQLAYLREAYAPLMENNRLRNEFLFLTQADAAVDSENFQKVSESIGSMQSFMESYRDRLKAEPLSEAVGNPAQVSTAQPEGQPEPATTIEPEIPEDILPATLAPAGDDAEADAPSPTPPAPATSAPDTVAPGPATAPEATGTPAAAETPPAP